MICKACGTQCRGPFCSHCGAPLENAAPQAPVPQPSAVPAPSATAPVATAPQKEESAKGRRTRHPRVRVKMRQVFFPSLVFFLPLIYLFVDAFVVYSSTLQASAEGGTALHLLVGHLTDPAFAANPLSDVMAAATGTNAPLLTLLSVKGILTAPAAHPALVAPAVILALSAVVSALGGIFVLFTAGRALSCRPMAHFVVGGGFFAALAPLLADLAFRLYHVANGGMAAADAAMRGFGLSFEVLLTCALSLAVMLPAVRAIRRAAGGHSVLVAPPYSLICRNFLVCRLLGAIFALAAILVPFAGLLIELSPGVKLLDACLYGIENASYHAQVVFTAFFVGDYIATVNAAFPFFALSILPLMLLAALPALFSLLRLLLTRPIKVALLKRRQRAFLRTGKRLRRVAITIVAIYTLFAVTTLLLLLFGARAHVDFANVADTLTLMYLLLAFAKSGAALYTTGILLCTLSIVLSNIAGGFFRAFVALSLEKHPPKK